MRVLLVGWDAADWKVIDPLLERGEMPHLASIISSGVRGNIATLQPALSPMLWTSIATGKRPPTHGILGFTEPTPDGLRIQPVTSLGRTTKAIWNILHQKGKSSIVTGWWPSHPAEPIRGAMVSDHFPLQTSDAPGAPLRKGSVWPEHLTQQLSDLRVHGAEVTGEMLRMFAPDYDRVDQSKDKSIHDLAGLIAESMSLHGAATELMETVPWDFAAVYYVGLDHFSHRFMRYHAGKAPKRDEHPEIFQDVVRNAYRYHDAMLGRLLQLAGPDCAVMVVSDHGFHSDVLLPDYIPAEAAGPAVEHRPFGIFCMRAPGVPAGERVYGATVLDVTPTLLHLFGLPVGRDMDGKVLLNAFSERTPPRVIPSWDEVEGDDGRHPPELRSATFDSGEALRQLVSLGYIAPPEETENPVEACRMETRYNLARAWMDAERPDEAAPLFRLLISQDPESARFYTELFRALLLLGDNREASAVLEQFEARCAEMGVRAAVELERRNQERPTEALSLERHGPDAAEFRARRLLAEKAAGYSNTRLLMRCELALRDADGAERKTAAQRFLRQLDPALLENPQLAPFLADAFSRAGMDDEALALIRRAGEENPESAELLTTEARIHHFASRHAEAARAAIASLSLVYFQPFLHYVLGVALENTGDRERAITELRVALTQSPGLMQAHEALSGILAKSPDGLGQAGLHKAMATQARGGKKEKRSALRARVSAPPVFERIVPAPLCRDEVVTIVSGLPRSGTSMMMQMLRAGGVAPFTDGLRTADEDNPRGYLEHEQATRLHREVSWIPEARGKAVKIVAQLLPYLPRGAAYRVVFLHRDLSEVAASQRAMLERLGRAGAALSQEDLIRSYAGDLQRVQEWLRGRAEIAVLAVNYHDALAEPEPTARRLAEFFGEPFDIGAAASEVSAGLRRQHASSPRTAR